MIMQRGEVLRIIESEPWTRKREEKCTREIERMRRTNGREKLAERLRPDERKRERKKEKKMKER